LNARRLHIKSGIGYKTGDIQQLKNQNIKTTNNASYAHTNASHVSHMSYYDFDASYVLMRNRFEKSDWLACSTTPQEVKVLCVDVQVPCY
jgi:hypothetical protein